MTRGTRIALAVAGLTLLCTLGVCATGVVLARQFAAVADCPTSRVPEVSGVKDDPRRVPELIPELGEVSAAHWRWRETRPRTCPDFGPMDLIYEGFAVLSPDRAAALLSAYPWEPAAAPEVPAELARHAPSAPAWRRSAAFNSASGAAVWLDPDTRTAYFSYLRG